MQHVTADLVLLPAFPFLLNLLLLLQLLRDASLTQGLPLAALVRLGVQGRFQGRVSPHAHHNFLTQLLERFRLKKKGINSTGDAVKYYNSAGFMPPTAPTHSELINQISFDRQLTCR